MDARSLLPLAVGLIGVVGLVLVAGCTGDPPRDRAVNATFEPNASGEQLDDLIRRLREWGPNLTVAASEPLRVVISDVTEEDCQEIRELLQGLDYIAEVGPCRRGGPPT